MSNDTDLRITRALQACAGIDTHLLEQCLVLKMAREIKMLLEMIDVLRGIRPHSGIIDLLPDDKEMVERAKELSDGLM